MAALIQETLSGSTQTFTYDPSVWMGDDDIVVFLDSGSGVTLTGNVAVVLTADPPQGTTIRYYWGADIVPDGYSLTINGTVIPDYLVAVSAGFTEVQVSVTERNSLLLVPLDQAQVFDGAAIVESSIPFSRLAVLTSGQMIFGNGTKNPTIAVLSGDGTISSLGVLTIANSAITNVKVSASAAIARTKLASGTASYVLANDGSGVMSEQQYVSKAQGGFGTSVAAATGFVRFAGGTLSIGAINESMNYQVSFDSGEVGAENTYTIGFDCTLTPTNCSAFVIKTIAATDDAVVTLMKNGIAIASGTITFAASSALDAAGVFGSFAATAFTAGDTLSLVTSKGTAGGKACISLQFTRTT